MQSQFLFLYAEFLLGGTNPASAKIRAAQGAWQTCFGSFVQCWMCFARTSWVEEIVVCVFHFFGFKTERHAYFGFDHHMFQYYNISYRLYTTGHSLTIEYIDDQREYGSCCSYGVFLRSQNDVKKLSLPGHHQGFQLGPTR